MTQVFTEHQANEALSKAKIALMSRADSAFFTTLAFSLIHEFDASIPTAATNGKRIKYNPDFFMNMSHDERVFLMLHEAMHCAYLHMVRNKGHDKRRFNIAADHVINLQLLDRGFKMPASGLADPQYKDMSAEEVYKFLPEPPPGSGNSNGGGMGGFGQDLEDPDAGDPPEQLEQDIQDILCRAAMQSKLSGDKPGSIPGEIELFLDRLLNPKLPWHRVLQKYLNEYSKNDYSFKRPNRRFFPQHYLPSMHSENLMDFAAFTDISGSVTDHEYHVQVSEVASILRMMKPKKISFGQFDTEIKQVDTIHNITDLMNVQFTGRGGTMIEPVFEWAKINKPQLLMIFTDGYFTMPADLTCKSNVIWLIYNNPDFTAPIGKVVHYEITEP